MNKDRRNRLKAIVSQLEDLKNEIDGIKDEEQEYSDNLPDNFAEKKEAADDVVQLGEDALSELDGAVTSLESVIESVGEMQA